MRRAPLLFLVPSALFQVANAQQPGDLDPSFHADGVTITDFAGDSDHGYGMALQPDGKVVIVGMSNGMYQNTALVRYLTNGELDPGFGIGGRVVSALGTHSSRANAVALQADGRVVIAGLANGGGPGLFGVARYTADGMLDVTFDTDGVRQDSVCIGVSEGNAIALQTDGKIVMVGGGCMQFAVARYNVDGSLDNTFSNDGLQITQVGYNAEAKATGVQIQPDGHILVTGYATDIGQKAAFALARYAPDGTLDQAFGTGGIVLHPFMMGSERAFAMALQPDGRIVLAGEIKTTGDPQHGHLAFARYHSDGTPDLSFGGDGFVTFSMGLYSRANAVIIAPDGRILAAGIDETAGLLAVLLPNGSFDTSFSNDGMQTAALGNFTWGECMALQPDGKILVGGTVNADPADFFVARYLFDLDMGTLEFADDHAAPLIYPNPITGDATLRFALKESTPITISLIDAEGRTVQRFVESASYSAGAHQLTLPFSDAITPGNYVLDIASPGGRTDVHVVKQ